MPALNPKFSNWNNDQVLAEWQRVATVLAEVKTNENELRLEAFARMFPNPVEGVNRKALGNAGWFVKCDYKFNYSVEKDDMKRQPIFEQIRELSYAFDPGLCNRLFPISYDLSQKEYKKLAPELLEVAQEIVTVKPGMPALTIEPPKA